MTSSFLFSVVDDEKARAIGVPDAESRHLGRNGRAGSKKYNGGR